MRNGIKPMSESEARQCLIDLMNYMAYRETEYSLLICDKNLLFGSEHYRLEPGREPWVGPSPWGEGEIFESKMSELLQWGKSFSRSTQEFQAAIELLRGKDDILGLVIRRAFPE